MTSYPVYVEQEPMATLMVTVRRALLSCADKAGLEVFAKELAALGVELIASGGTAQALTQAGVRVKSVEDFAGISEQLDGRVKTLHPKIHAGILARRDDPAHVQAVGAAGLIDLVVVNLYPFAQTAQRPGVTVAEAVEQIDIGGVALLRAAAKNSAHVAVVCQPQQYDAVARGLRAGKGQLPVELTRELAVAAFKLTSAYDAAIAAFLGRQPASSVAAGATGLPETATLTLRRHQALRYGENPHQQGAWYLPATEGAWGVGTLRQLQGKELSYNNLLDTDAALRCLLEFEEPACVVIKHGVPCGLAVGPTLQQAYERAYACDPESAFGGIVGCNQPIDTVLAQRLTETFLEVVCAPSVEAGAQALLAKKPNLRAVTIEWPRTMGRDPEWRQLLGSWLLQDPDRVVLSAETLRTVTRRAPTADERVDLLVAWKAAKHAQSNGVVVVRGGATVGIGQGQPSRIGSVRMAIQKAGERARGAVVASDGFFPFPDGVELLAKAGVTAVIQPGGSIRDADTVAAADAANVAMLVTGIRHFRH